jgi:hypothetical protein
MREFRRVPDELEELVAQSLAFDPAVRPTAQEFADTLFGLVPTLDDTPPHRPGSPADSESTSLMPAVQWPG